MSSQCPPPEEDILGFFQHWAKATSSHTKPDYRQMARVACAAMDHMKEQVVELIQAAEDKPVLLSYMSDGTPIITRHHIGPAFDGVAAKRRSGRSMDELLCQCAFYVTIDAKGARQANVLLQDPRPQICGKKPTSLLSSALDFVVSPHSCGHQGILIYHCTFRFSPPAGPLMGSFPLNFLKSKPLEKCMLLCWYVNSKVIDLAMRLPSGNVCDGITKVKQVYCTTQHQGDYESVLYT